MKIAIVIVHNKTDAENAGQIDFLKSLIVRNERSQAVMTQDRTTEEVDIEYTSDDGSIKTRKEFREVLIGNPYQTTETSYFYTVKNLNIPHEVIIMQIIPYGVTPPLNRYEINSGGIVQYGERDKVGNHPRFFNWGIKRGTDYGADIVIYLDQVQQLSTTRLSSSLSKLTNNTEFVESQFGKIATVKLLKVIGQLKEDMPITQAISDLKARVLEGGLKNG